MSILATRRLPGPAFDELEGVELLEPPLREALSERRPGVRVLIAFSDSVDAQVLDNLPDLELVANFGIGHDLIDVGACAERGVAVTLTPGVLDDATADLTLALMLAVRRRLLEADRFIREGRWAGEGVASLMADDVAGSTLGIVGMGRVGTAVARRARAFGMKILYSQRTRHDPDRELELSVEYRPLDDMLSQVDILSLHCPLTPETRALLDERRLGLLRDGACLVNTARGGVVDEDALVSELVTGRLRAGLDVFAHEPVVPRALVELENVVLAPHLGSATGTTRAAMTQLVVDNVRAFERGEPLLTPLLPSG